MGCCASKDVVDVEDGSKRRRQREEMHEVKPETPAGEESGSAEVSREGLSKSLPPPRDDRPPAPGTERTTSPTGSGEAQRKSPNSAPAPPSTRPRVVLPLDPQEEEARLRRIELMEEVSKPTVMDFGVLDRDDDPMAGGSGGVGDGDAADADADAIILNFNDDFEERVERGEISGEGINGLSRSTGRENNSPPSPPPEKDQEEEEEKDQEDQEEEEEESEEPPTDQWFNTNSLPLPVVEWYQNTTTVFITIKLGSSEDCDAGWDLEQHEILRCILHSTDGECYQQAMYLAGTCKDSEFLILEDGLCLKVKKQEPCTSWTQLFKSSPETMEKITWLQRRPDLEADAWAEEAKAAGPRDAEGKEEDEEAEVKENHIRAADVAVVGVVPVVGSDGSARGEEEEENLSMSMED